MTYDFCVVGGGIVGLSTAMHLLQQRPGSSLLLIEKEDGIARHQTGHNSGVIHSGIYYKPGSRKAEFCRRGAEQTLELCQEFDIPVEVCGKLLVATTELDLERMRGLVTRAAENGVAAIALDAGELAEVEPHVRGLGALRIPSTGIVDYKAVSRAIAAQIEKLGGELRFGSPVDRIQERRNVVEISAGGEDWRADRLVVCGGLQADRLARLAGLAPDFRIVPFRGEYYRLPASRRDLISHLIYPVPDPSLPFLGVHLTKVVGGGITVGPNAVLGWAREGYPKGSFSAADVRDYATFPGMWKFARANVGTGLRELRNSWFKRAYLRECRKYCPELTLADLQPEPAGIRAQVVARDGSMVEDFLFLETDRMLHVGNAPSPAATAALPIGEYIAARCSRP